MAAKVSNCFLISAILLMGQRTSECSSIADLKKRKLTGETKEFALGGGMHGYTIYEQERPHKIKRRFVPQSLARNNYFKTHPKPMINPYNRNNFNKNYYRSHIVPKPKTNSAIFPFGVPYPPFKDGKSLNTLSQFKLTHRPVVKLAPIPDAGNTETQITPVPSINQDYEWLKTTTTKETYVFEVPSDVDEDEKELESLSPMDNDLFDNNFQKEPGVGIETTAVSAVINKKISTPSDVTTRAKIRQTPLMNQDIKATESTYGKMFPEQELLHTKQRRYVIQPMKHLYNPYSRKRTNPLQAYPRNNNVYGNNKLPKPTTKKVSYPFGAPAPPGLFSDEMQLDILSGITPNLKVEPKTSTQKPSDDNGNKQDQPVTNACSCNICMNGGICMPEGEEDFSCACVDDYAGYFCEKPFRKCSDIDYCGSISSCVAYPREAICLCDKMVIFCRMDLGEPTQEERIEALVTHRYNVLIVFGCVVALLSLCTCIHCCRVCVKRDTLREKYREGLKWETVPDDLPPDVMTICSSLCLCRGSELDKKVEVQQIQAPIEEEEKPKKKKKKKKKSKKNTENDSMKKKKSKSKKREESDDNQTANCYRKKSKIYPRFKYYISDDENTNAQNAWGNFDAIHSHRSYVPPRYRTITNKHVASERKDNGNINQETDSANESCHWKGYTRKVPDHKQYTTAQSRKLCDNSKPSNEKDYTWKVPRHQGYKVKTPNEQGNAISQGIYSKQSYCETSNLDHVKLNPFVNTEVPRSKRHSYKSEKWTRHYYDPVAVMNLVWSDVTNYGSTDSESHTSSEEIIYEKRT